MPYRPATALFATLFAVGAFSQMAQGLLAREMLVAFLGNEISLGAFYGGWLGWIGVGGAGAAWLHRRRPGMDTGRWLRGGLFLLPLALAGQLLAVRSVRLLIPMPAGGFLPLGDLLLATVLLILPVGVLVGFLFPLAGERLAEENHARLPQEGAAGFSLLFAAEAVGALLGGVAFTLLLAQRVAPLHLLGLALLLPWGAALLLTPPTRQRWLLAPPLLLALLLTLQPLPALEHALERLRLSALLPGMTLMESVETRFGHVALVGLGAQRSVVVDGRVGESFPNPEQARLDAAFVHAQAGNPRRILLLGGLYGGVAEALLDYPGVERLEVVLEDPAAFAMIRPHLPAPTRQALDDPRLHLTFEDGRRFVNRLEGGEGYDLVVSLPGDPSSARQNRYFTREFFDALRRAMAPDGVFCTRVGSASNYLGREVKSHGGSLFATLGQVFPQVSLTPGDHLTFCAGAVAGGVSESPAELIARYRAHPPAGAGISPALFHALLPAEQTAYTRARLEEEAGAINLDRQPVSFFLNLMIWGKYSASDLGEILLLLQRLGGWLVLIPAGLVSLMLILGRFAPHADLERNRQHVVAWALGGVGLAAMAAQMLVLYAYQSRVGFIYSRIALLNALFMLGLALGAGAGRFLARHPLAGLMGVMGLTAGFCAFFSTFLLLPPGLGEEGGFFLLSLLVGGLTGAGFPPAVRLLHGETALEADGAAHRLIVAGGLAEAADHIGGALGGLLTGVLLMPMLGWEGSGRLLAGLLLLTLLPLLAVRLLPTHAPRFWRMRALPSFPHTRLTRTLGWSVLGLVLLTALARSNAPPPQQEFNDELLRQVSGEHHFTPQQTPFVHYLGRAEKGGAVTSVLLASQPVAPEVRGYGGPLNLLVAVDAQGRLRGVRLLASRESPSYIQGMEAWLNGLKGTDLIRTPLDLDHVDGLSGATVSSRAALESIRRAAAVAAQEVFHLPLAAPLNTSPPPWSHPVLLGVLGLLLLLPPVHYRAGAVVRRLFLLATLLVAGVAGNVLLTEADLAHLLLGVLPGWDGREAWFLLACTAVLLTPLLGPLHCAWLCPFGAAQELISWFGKRLGLRLHPSPSLDRHARHLKYLLLVLGVVGVCFSGEPWMLSFNPMQEFFSGRMQPTLAFLAGMALLGSLFYFRFWCRTLCPMGACLALGNKSALLEPLAPHRDFHHCDLGVGHTFDVDCIRCQRCAPAGLRDRFHPPEDAPVLAGRGARVSPLGHDTEMPGQKAGFHPLGDSAALAGRGARFRLSGDSPAPMVVQWKQNLADGLLKLLLGVVLVGILVHLEASREAVHGQVGGWRKIDPALVRQQMQSGRLAEREADWYRRETP